jgi:phenylpropionate dioxygenase-like ring-hydroxylating dioxygenase large terminal subunit
MMERTLHRDFYFSDEIFELEKEKIFCREWVCAGWEEEVPNPLGR